MADEIHVFKSTDTNAPVLTGENGKLVDLLTAVLVDGYSTVSVSSITRSGATATVTTGSAHGIVDGQWVTIAGADQADYNGRFAANVTSTTAFEITVANSPATPATGTITARRASAGWDLAYSGTNKAVYRSPNNASQRHYLRVLDDASSTGGAKEASCRGYVSMSDVDTGTEPFPTEAQQATGLYMQKSTTADSTARTWMIVADDKTFYLYVNSSSGRNVHGFGHMNSWKSGDGYNSFIAASRVSNSFANGNTTGVMGGISTNNEFVPSYYVIYMPRVAAQTGTSVRVATYASGISQTGDAEEAFGYKASNAGNGFAGPSTNADGGVYVAPILVLEIAAKQSHIIRGTLPGVYASLVGSDITSGNTYNGIAGLDARDLLCQSFYGSAGGATGYIFFDTTGPW